jgi:hypothetical protein
MFLFIHFLSGLFRSCVNQLTKLIIHRLIVHIVLSKVICSDRTQTATRGAIFSPKWPRFSVILTKFRGKSPQNVVCCTALQINFESTISTQTTNMK